ncbi:kinase-like domain-containing protein [Irpex rosettiformis]|uniref:Kinase-like domain-containing protein n=1 Tax=Irpex rosettiformis TaxID=378272 RepID=A0ACB8UJY5_9APHY|nr:kinase-like domain-containing protein [Irpex rosettiformis]
MSKDDGDDDARSLSDSESEDYLWTSRRCRQSRQESGDRIKMLLHRGMPVCPVRSQAVCRSRSCPPSALPLNPHLQAFLIDKGGGLFIKVMLSTATTVDLTFDDDDWVAPQAGPKLYRAASVGNSWGVTSFGRGFNWKREKKDDENCEDHEQGSRHMNVEAPHPQTAPATQSKSYSPWSSGPSSSRTSSPVSTPAISALTPIHTTPPHAASYVSGPLSRSPVQSPSSSPRPMSPATLSANHSPLLRSQSSPRLDNDIHGPRSRRRSSHQRVSLIAGRVSIVPSRPSSPPPTTPQKLVRANSAASFLSVASSTGPPTPGIDKTPSVGERSISEFVIEGEIGRGAYGLVKRAREMNLDGSSGPPLIIKQIIKSRILADCWKRHPKYGTIPIEIYVMSAISSTSYVLPPRRPWDPSRFDPEPDPFWTEGKIVNGHPNICPLLDFFEDNHYYYLVLPSTTPEPIPNEPPPPSDLFDLVESYPHGLPSALIRSYLGQIADAMTFLHSKGIVHRDIKDENVVLGPAGKCVLIDFGSSGLVRKGGWDTFSGTLDYAGPEILRGERYQGKEQDVWAFGVVAYVMLVGECPFTTAAEAQEGLESPFCNASIGLDERCGDGKELEGKEVDGGGALGDAAALVRACLQLKVGDRPTFEKIISCRFLSGHPGGG